MLTHHQWSFCGIHKAVRYKTKVGSLLHFATKFGSFSLGEIGRLSPNFTAKEYVIESHLSSGSTAARLQLLTSVFTHSDRVSLGLPFFLVPGIGKFVIDLIQDMACCTWPYHLSRWWQRIDIISTMPSFCSREDEGVSLCLWCRRSSGSWQGHCGRPSAVQGYVVTTFCYRANAGKWKS